jgi:hypothetical protein
MNQMQNDCLDYRNIITFCISTFISFMVAAAAASVSTDSKMNQPSPPQAFTNPRSPTGGHDQPPQPTNPITFSAATSVIFFPNSPVLRPAKSFPALDWTTTLHKGDLILAVQRLQIKGINASQKATEWAENVCGFVKQAISSPPEYVCQCQWRQRYCLMTKI